MKGGGREKKEKKRADEQVWEGGIEENEKERADEREEENMEGNKKVSAEEGRNMTEQMRRTRKV